MSTGEQPRQPNKHLVKDLHRILAPYRHSNLKAPSIYEGSIYMISRIHIQNAKGTTCKFGPEIVPVNDESFNCSLRDLDLR